MNGTTQERFRPSTLQSALESELRTVQNDIVRIDMQIKMRIEEMPNTAKSERILTEETRHVKDGLKELQTKIEMLANSALKVNLRSEASEIECAVEMHRKELEENRKALRMSAQKTRSRIAETARSALLEGASLEVEMRRRRTDEKNLKENSGKATERLSDLVSKMGERVKQSEESMDGLVHSSSVLSKTQGEFESQSGHIQTGSKLLSKYERRELTDKILVCIALLFYFAVVYYILQKRIFNKFWLW